MKPYVLPVIIVALFSVTTFSQTHIDKKAKQIVDVNGTPLKNTAVQLNAPFSSPSVMTSYIYDSVRALTEINDTVHGNAYPWISADGLRLYYTSRTDTGTFIIKFTQRANTNSFFVTPTILSISVPNTLSCWLSSDELDIYLSGIANLYYAHRDSISLPFSTAIKISLLGCFPYPISNVSLNSEQDELFLCSGGVGIFDFSRSSDTSFNYIGMLQTPSEYGFDPGQLSKDDLTIFISAYHLPYNKDFLTQMTRISPSDTFDTSTFQQIQGINDFSVWNCLPSMSDSLNWVVFVRSNGTWEGDDLFIAHRGVTTSVFNPGYPRIISSAFPNPTSDYLFIKYKTSSTAPITLSILSSEGKIIDENVVSSSSQQIKIDTREMQDGFYFYRLSQDSDNKIGNGTGKFVVLH